MTQQTLDFAQMIVDIQEEYTRKFREEGRSKMKITEQDAYYRGMNDMLQIILTEGYTKPLWMDFATHKYSLSEI